MPDTAGEMPEQNAIRKRRLAVVLVSSAAISVLVASASASAATYTVGSPLTASFVAGGLGTDTIANNALPEPGAKVSSPVTGRVVSWRILDATRGPLAPRVLTPNRGIPPNPAPTARAHSSATTT